MEWPAAGLVNTGRCGPTMRYSRVHLESIGYELAPVVVSTTELENRLAPVYKSLGMALGQLELLTGLLVYVRRTQNSEYLFVCRQGYWSCYYSTCAAYGLNDLFS